MKITYRGGFDKQDPKHVEQFILSSHADFVEQSLKDRKRIAVVTYAKPDGYYDPNIRKYFGNDVDIVDTSTPTPEWESYDIIYLLGGYQLQLLDLLKKNNFSLSELKDEVHLIGDSAGAMVLSSYFYWTEDNGTITFHEGINAASNLITIVHANNQNYVPKPLFDIVKSFAKQNRLKVLTLDENQEATK